MKTVLLVCISLVFLMCQTRADADNWLDINRARLKNVDQWCVLLDYNDEKPYPPESFLQYDLVVFDADDHPPMEMLRPDTIRIAYVSIGEAEVYRSYWKKIKHKSWVSIENPDWAGNFYVDVRDPEWQSLLLDVLIPDILRSGFEGLMMDTVDTVDGLLAEDPIKYAGIKEAMVQLIQNIHERFPQLMLLSNNGFTILKDISPYLSSYIVEDIHMMIDFEHNSYMKVPLDDYTMKVELLQPLMQEFGTSVFNIDYVDSKEEGLRAQVYEESLNLGFKPYVAERNLSGIYTTPQKFDL